MSDNQKKKRKDNSQNSQLKSATSGRSHHKRNRTEATKFGRNEHDVNYDSYFDELDENISDTDFRARNEETEKTVGVVAHQSVSSKPAGESMSMAELLSMIEKMSITILYSTEQINSLGGEIRQMTKEASLFIDEEGTTDDDLPFLTKMEAFHLPNKNREQLEQLKNTLNADKSFYLFFVCQNIFL